MGNNSIPQITRRAILYARTSGDDSANVTSSIDAQLAECRKYANQRGYVTVDEVFEDPKKHTSGADWLPELDRVIRLAPSHTFDVLICHKVDRLSRDRYKHLGIKIELRKHGVSVEYAALQFEDSAEGALLEGMVSQFAEYELAVINRRTNSGKLRSVEAGNVMIGGSGAPYGYDVATVDGKRVLVVNDHEAGIVRQLFTLYAMEGYTLYQLKEYLDSRKVPLPSKGNNHRKRSKGTVWSAGTISGMLDQEVYLGAWHYRKTKFVKDPITGKPRNIPRPRDEWLEVAVPAIITKELFDAVQRRREFNKHAMGHQRKHEYALGGMLECGHCHIAMSGVAKVDRGRIHRYLKCNAHHEPKKYGYKCDNAQFKADVVEAAVWNWIKGLLMDTERLRSGIEETQALQRQRMQPQISMLESSRGRLAELETQRSRLIDAYQKGVLSLDDLAKQKTALDKEIGELGQAIAMLQAEAEPHVLTAEHIDTIEAIAERLREELDFATHDKMEQRAIYQILDVHVILSYDGQQRWADCTCYLGQERYAVDSTSILSIAKKSAR